MWIKCAPHLLFFCFVSLGGFTLAMVKGATPTPNPAPFPVDTPSIPIPVAREILESATWLSRQQATVWLAIVLIILGVLVYAVLRHLLRSIDSQRQAHKEEIKEMRQEFATLQTEEKGLSLQLLQYLEKDHAQTIVLVKDNQSIMQETVSLLKAIQQERHDEKLLREQNHEILKRLDPKAKAQLNSPGPQ